MRSEADMGKSRMGHRDGDKDSCRVVDELYGYRPGLKHEEREWEENRDGK